MLVHRGTLRVGDAAVAGDAAGKVRALYDYRGEKVKEAKPGDPIEILGFDHPPTAGEFVRVVEHERQAKHLANVRPSVSGASSSRSARAVASPSSRSTGTCSLARSRT